MGQIELSGVKQAEACLTQPEARELAQYLERQARVPAEFNKAKVRTGVSLPKRIVEPEDLERAAFKHVFHIPGPLPQPDVASAKSEDALVRFSALLPYADIGRAGLTRAAWLVRLREVRIGEVRYGTRRWVGGYQASRYGSKVAPAKQKDRRSAAS